MIFMIINFFILIFLFFFLKKNKEKFVCIRLNWLILLKRWIFNKLYFKFMSVEIGNYGYIEYVSDWGIME